MSLIFLYSCQCVSPVLVPNDCNSNNLARAPISSKAGLRRSFANLGCPTTNIERVPFTSCTVSIMCFKLTKVRGCKSWASSINKGSTAFLVDIEVPLN